MLKLAKQTKEVFVNEFISANCVPRNSIVIKLFKNRFNFFHKYLVEFPDNSSDVDVDFKDKLYFEQEKYERLINDGICKINFEALKKSDNTFSNQVYKSIDGGWGTYFDGDFSIFMIPDVGGKTGRIIDVRKLILEKDQYAISMISHIERNIRISVYNRLTDMNLSKFSINF